MATCTHCGGVISPHDRTCPYCGAQNPDFRPLGASVAALLEEGLRAYRDGRYLRSIECLEQVIAEDENVFYAYFYLASAYTAYKWYEKAIEAMRHAIALRPHYAMAWYNLGVLYDRVGYDREKVCETLRKAYELLDPNDEEYGKVYPLLMEELAKCKEKKKRTWQK